MQHFELTAELRTGAGKGASRRLRRTGKVPGILYGTGKEPVSIQLSHDDLNHQLQNEAFYSHILKLNLGDVVEDVVLRDLQRHPYRPILMHVDLQRIDMSEKITMRVPLHITNAAVSPGVKDEKGILINMLTQVEVICLPKDLPAYIEVDASSLHVGQSIHLADLKLPEGVELELLVSGGDADQAVVVIQPPQTEEAEASAASTDAAAPAAAAGGDAGKTGG